MEVTPFTAEVTLTIDQVKEAIKNYVATQMDVDVLTVNLNLDTAGGDSPGCPQPILKNAAVRIQKKQEPFQFGPPLKR